MSIRQVVCCASFRWLSTWSPSRTSRRRVGHRISCSPSLGSVFEVPLRLRRRHRQAPLFVGRVTGRAHAARRITLRVGRRAISVNGIRPQLRIVRVLVSVYRRPRAKRARRRAALAPEVSALGTGSARAAALTASPQERPASSVNTTRWATRIRLRRLKVLADLARIRTTSGAAIGSAATVALTTLPLACLVSGALVPRTRDENVLNVRVGIIKEKICSVSRTSRENAIHEPVLMNMRISHNKLA